MNTFSKINNFYKISSSINILNIGVLGKAANHIDYTQNFTSIRQEEKKLIKKITGIDEKKIIFLNQVHHDNIVNLDTSFLRDDLYIGDADGIITNQTNICLVIRTADCVPAFMYDQKNNILGAVHSGWRGSRLGISSKLLKKMNSCFGSAYNDIYVFILPSISPRSYSINKDVAIFFNNDIIEKNNKTYLNLWQNIKNVLIKEGIPEENIFNTEMCNYENSNEFFSHRSGDIGRNLNFGFIK